MDIKDIITYALTIWGLVIATKGLVTWRKQIKGTKEFETAYNLHYSTLKLRDAIKHVRNPAIWPSESYKASQYFKAKYPEKSLGDMDKKSHSYVYEMRWEEITTAFTEIESHLLSAEVLWGKEVLNLLKPLNKKVSELNIGLKQYFQPEFRTKDYMELHNIIYNQGSENDDDEFSKSVEKAIGDIGIYLKPKIG